MPRRDPTHTTGSLGPVGTKYKWVSKFVIRCAAPTRLVNEQLYLSLFESESPSFPASKRTSHNNREKMTHRAQLDAARRRV